VAHLFKEEITNLERYFECLEVEHGSFPNTKDALRNKYRIVHMYYAMVIFFESTFFHWSLINLDP